MEETNRLVELGAERDELLQAVYDLTDVLQRLYIAWAENADPSAIDVLIDDDVYGMLRRYHSDFQQRQE